MPKKMVRNSLKTLEWLFGVSTARLKSGTLRMFAIRTMYELAQEGVMPIINAQARDAELRAELARNNAILDAVQEQFIMIPDELLEQDEGSSEEEAEQ